jgi:hypothetical protein
MMTGQFPKLCNACQRVHDYGEWIALTYVGDMYLPKDDHGPETNLEMRNCLCGSTIAIDHASPEGG